MNKQGGSKRIKIGLAIVVTLSAIAGVLYYIMMSAPRTLEQLVQQSDIVAIGSVRGYSTGRAMPDSNKTPDGDHIASTDYVINVVKTIYKKSSNTPDSFYLALPGGFDKDGKKYTVAGIPKLENEQEYLFFAKIGKDGMVRPIADGYAITQETNRSFTLPEQVNLKEPNKFTLEELEKAASKSN